MKQEWPCPLCPDKTAHDTNRPHEVSVCRHCDKAIWRIIDDNPSTWSHIQGFMRCEPKPPTRAEPVE